MWKNFSSCKTRKKIIDPTIKKKINFPSSNKTGF